MVFRMKHESIVLKVIYVLAAALMVASLAMPAAAAKKPMVKNVIVIVPDGCDASVQTLTRWYKGDDLTVDSMLVGNVKTYMADSVITDSAAAATAFASGVKTSDGFIGVGPRLDTLLTTMPEMDPSSAYKPLATVLEGAKLLGKATGLVATSRITHATPAAFAAHIESRDMENEIMEQMVYENIDVVFGGGKRHLLPATDGGKRTDGEDLKQVIMDKGYQFVENKEEMMAVKDGKVWGMFASSHMEADVDRAEFAPNQPSLSEMTSKALELLSQDPDGFFVMIEASQVDWAGHANDPFYMVTDFLEYDNAVKVAVDFAKANGNTLVLSFPDHTTGGLTIGNERSNSNYTAITVEDLLNPLKNMKITSTGIGYKIGSDVTPENVKAQVKEWWGIELTDDQVSEILAIVEGGGYMNTAISYVVSKNYTYFGWTTWGHNGEDVPLFAFGPGAPFGLYDNTDLPKLIAQAMGFDLAKVNNRLFVEVSSVFDNYEVDMTTDPENLVLKVAEAKLPVSKNIIHMDGADTELEGVVVYAPKTNNVYIPLQAVNMIKGEAAVVEIASENCEILKTQGGPQPDGSWHIIFPDPSNVTPENFWHMVDSGIKMFNEWDAMRPQE